MRFVLSVLALLLAFAVPAKANETEWRRLARELRLADVDGFVETVKSVRDTGKLPAARYIDKNYGGIFIIWDRLFGTFVEEDDRDPVVYGTRAPLRSFNPLWANLQVYRDLWLDSWRAQSWTDKLRVWFEPPGWRPADVAARWPKPAFDIAAVQRAVFTES